MDADRLGGASHANGNGPGAPYANERRQGWDIRPVTHWDFTQGRDPA